MTATRWPFGDDADRDDPLTALRVPAVRSFNPQWRYIAAYVKPQRELGHLISEIQHPDVEDAFAALAPHKPAPITIRFCTMPDEAGR